MATSIPTRSTRSVSVSQNYPTGSSPNYSMNTPPAGHLHAMMNQKQQGRALTEFPLHNPKQRILLLENINQTAIDAFKDADFDVEAHPKAMNEDDLIAKLNEGQFHMLGIRSKTQITSRVIQSCPSLIAVGCFCIGTNQVDLNAAVTAGIPVFNSPFANSRSVAELVISEIIALSRQLCDRSTELHRGVWNKVSKNCWEVRGKTLGIIGYGHIGSQLSVLAESMGMSVVYHDIVPMMPLGSAQQLDSLEAVFEAADFVSLHVPDLPETRGMITGEQLEHMKDGAYLINNARGKVVDIPALVDHLQSKHLAGAALDVYPNEPAANGNYFNDDLNSWWSKLVQCPNVILTPHIGGSTEEAQRMIGVEVSTSLINYQTSGSSIGSVNFPEVSLRANQSDETCARLCYVHHNQPGVLKRINAIIGDYNVVKQFSDSKGDIAYLLADIVNVDEKDLKNIYDEVLATPSNVATRILI